MFEKHFDIKSNFSFKNDKYRDDEAMSPLKIHDNLLELNYWN